MMAPETPVLYHWEPNSNPGKAMLILAEKGIDYEGHYVDLLAMEQHRPEYLALNPRGTIPTLVHGQNILTESTPMMEYIDAAFPGPRFTPGNAIERWRMRWWMRFFDSYLAPAISMGGWKRFIGPAALERDIGDIEAAIKRIPLKARRSAWRKALHDDFSEAELAESQRRYRYGLYLLEAHLCRFPWIAGNDYSLGDMNGFTLGYAFPSVQPDYCNDCMTPRIMDWLRRICARPAVRKTWSLGRTHLASRLEAITVKPDADKEGI